MPSRSPASRLPLLRRPTAAVTYQPFFFFSRSRRHTRWPRDWCSDVCSSELIFREGGLPFSSLKDTGNRFQRFFSSVLKRYKGYRDFGYSTNRLVADRVEQAGLPRVFQEEESIELLAAMADGLVTLVDFYALEEKADPSMLLDQLKPDWRDSFPIPLDVDTGRDFVNSLLQSASREINDSQRRLILDCKHYFTAGRPDQLLTEVSFPNEIAITLLEEVESSRLEVAMQEGKKLAVDWGPYYAEDRKSVV